MPMTRFPRLRQVAQGHGWQLPYSLKMLLLLLDAWLMLSLANSILEEARALARMRAQATVIKLTSSSSVQQGCTRRK